MTVVGAGLRPAPTDKSQTCPDQRKNHDIPSVHPSHRLGSRRLSESLRTGAPGIPRRTGNLGLGRCLIEEWRISLKRIVFIYECLLELPVVIRRGDVAAEVLAFAREHAADGVATAFSPSPRFRAICDRLRDELPVAVLPVEPFLAYTGRLDLRRFSRYWATAEKYAFGQLPLFDDQ